MAIARDVTSGGSLNFSATSPISWNHTCTGSNLYLIVYLLFPADDFTGCTYNGVAMTQLAKTLTFAGYYAAAYGLHNPATGTHAVSATSSSTANLHGASYSYTGVNQSTTPNASNGQHIASQASPFVTTLTTTADSCWMWTGGFAAAGQTASTGATFLTSDNGSDGRNSGIYDSNGSVGTAGSHSMNITLASTTELGHVTVALAPYVAPAGPANLKTFNGVAKASIKTINGVAIASVKTLNGVA